MKKFKILTKNPMEDFVQTENVWLSINEKKNGYCIEKKSDKVELLLAFHNKLDKNLKSLEESNIKENFDSFSFDDENKSFIYINSEKGISKFRLNTDSNCVVINRENKSVYFLEKGQSEKPWLPKNLIITFNKNLMPDNIDMLTNLACNSKFSSYVLLKKINDAFCPFEPKIFPIFAIENYPHQAYSFSIKSSLKTISMIIDMIKSHVLQYHSEKIWKIETVLHEALVNAITYGNEMDYNKQVVINYEVGSIGLRVFIKDSGEGFDVKHISVPVGKESLDRISGRGIYIMKKFSDSIYYSEKGNEVTIFFSFS